MAIREVPLDIIDDNPFNPRKHYAQAKIKEMAISLQENGLRQVPEGREVDGRVQLAYGHMRLRGYRYNQKHQVPGSWATMPVDVKDLTDADMFHYAMEENIRRTDITPLETARCIEGFNQAYPDILDEDIAKKHGMTAANVSNMKRVLRLPEKFLEKIDEGLISFTQGRELLTLEGIPNAEELMSSALAGINTTGNKSYSKPNTVEGLQQSIHSTISSHFPPLDKEWKGYRWDLLFDTRETGCLKCDKCFTTHPTKSQNAHFCTDEECWKKKTEEHKQSAAAVARAKMEGEVLKRAAANISQEKSAPAAPPYHDLAEKAAGLPAAEAALETKLSKTYNLEKRGTSWIAIDGQGRIIAESHDKKVTQERAIASFELVATVVDPKPEEFLLNHTYRIVTKPGVSCPNFDVTAQSLSIGVKALGLKPGDVEFAKVHKSSGKIGTAGDVSAGWSKCTEPMEPPDVTAELYKERDLEEELEARVDGRDRKLDAQADRVLAEAGEDEDIATAMTLCADCLNNEECDGSPFYRGGDGQMHCDIQQTATAEAPPADVMERARAAAGTRAEVLDLNDISPGNQYSRQMKSGYAILDDELRFIDDPQECLERCTHGFHFAFDSRAKEPKEIHICSDPKCLAQKKGALTREKNAAGLARKNAERKAIKQVLEQVVQTAELLKRDSQGICSVAFRDAPIEPVTVVPRAFLELIIYNQLHGKQIATYYYGDSKKPEKWFWDKLSAGVPQEKRKDEALWNLIKKLTDSDMVKLITEYLVYYIQDHGDTGSYEIKTEKPIGFFGVDVTSFLEEVASGEN